MWMKAVWQFLPLQEDRGYDSEDNHLLVREDLHALSVIPARYEHVPIWRTHGKYRKQMKCGYSKLLYNQRNKDETIISVIKDYLENTLRRNYLSDVSLQCPQIN